MGEVAWNSYFCRFKFQVAGRGSSRVLIVRCLTIRMLPTVLNKEKGAPFFRGTEAPVKGMPAFVPPQCLGHSEKIVSISSCDALILVTLFRKSLFLRRPSTPGNIQRRF